MTNSLSYRHKIIKHPTPKTQSLLSVLTVTFMLLRAPGDRWQWTLLVEGAALQSPANSSAESQETNLGVRKDFRNMDHLPRTVPACDWIYTWSDWPRHIPPAWPCRGSRAVPSANSLPQTLSTCFVKRAAGTGERPKGL